MSSVQDISTLARCRERTAPLIGRDTSVTDTAATLEVIESGRIAVVDAHQAGE